MSVEHGHVRRVRFTPERVDDLRPEATPWIGREFDVTFAWVITPEDGGPYVGQSAWTPTDRSVTLGWIPDCDLTDA